MPKKSKTKKKKVNQVDGPESKSSQFISLPRWSFSDLIVFFFIAVFSFFFVVDLFASIGKSSTFDGATHITNMAMFHTSLQQLDVLSGWSDGFTPYGFPLPILAQQTSSWLGALFLFPFSDPVLAYKLVVLMGTFVGTSLLYVFGRYFAPRLISFVASLLFLFAPYRYINIFIRGNVAEIWAQVFVLVVLLGLVDLVAHSQVATSKKKNTTVDFVLIALGWAGIAWSHPMMLVPGGILIGFFILWLLLSRKISLFQLAAICMSSIVGLLITAHYVLPLMAEIKYFYYSQDPSHLNTTEFVPASQLLVENWEYFSETAHPNTRVQNISIGSIEVFILFIGMIAFAIQLSRHILFKKKTPELSLLGTWLGLGFLLLYFSTPQAEWAFRVIPLFDGLQFPWRMFAAFSLLPSFIVVSIFSRKTATFFPKATLFLVVTLASLLFWSRVPHMYSKNSMQHFPETYFTTKQNLHSEILNTVWMGAISSYDLRPQQFDIFEGEGEVLSAEIKNSVRKYDIDARTALKMVDYTFYFPGWEVEVDGQAVPLEFQNPNFRGIITFSIPEGQHSVVVAFKTTKIRFLARFASLMGISLLLATPLWLRGLHFVEDQLARLIPKNK